MASQVIEREETAARLPASLRRWLLPGALVVLLALAAGWVIGLYADAQMPGNDSAEAGFARDMSVHHSQAVEMALIVRDRTEDEQIHALATDILLTQLAEIGHMEGWLDVWGLSRTGDEPAMAWMGHEVTGRMPGMASPEEVAQLKTLPVDQMNVQFLRLMIVHHQAGVDMAEALLERSDNSSVRAFAETIITTQQNEIALMQQMLERLGAADGGSSPTATPSAEHEHGG